MKTPTLIVRLCGLYMLTTASAALFQFHQIDALAGGVLQGKSAFAAIEAYAWSGVAAGLVASLFAGPLARVLTFDAEPKEKVPDLSDQLLRRNERNG